MNIIYVITIFLIYILFILLHKTEKKQNIMPWLAISAILILCYNVFICVIYTFIDVLCTLQNLSICNFVTILAFLAVLLKTKKTQKYYIRIPEMVFSVLILILVLLIGYKQYGLSFNLKYETTDASSHYFFAQKFYEQSTLLYKGEIQEDLGISDFDFRLPGAYVNEGILFKIFNGTVANTDLFIIFDLFILYISGVLVYYLLIAHINKNKIMYIVAGAFSVIYMLGYQLNSMMYGYVYLSLALDIVITFILMIQTYEKEEILYTIGLPILTLLSFGMFFSYAYFIAAVYIAVVCNIIIKAIKKKEKIISEENLIELISLIIIPLIIGITYFVLLPLAKGGKTEISSIVVDGPIYKNYITNLATFVPILITSIIIGIKNRKKEKECQRSDYATILFIMSVIFAIILFIGHKLEKVSAYYFFKVYFFIWPIIILNMYIALDNILKAESKVLKIATYSYISIYIIAIVIATLVFKKSIGINDVFDHNMYYLINREYIIEKEEMKMLEKTQPQMDNHSIHVLGAKTMGRMRWMAALHQNSYMYVEQLMWQKITIESWLEKRETSYYMALYKDYKNIEGVELNLDENSDKYKIIYKNDYGFILERIRE